MSGKPPALDPSRASSATIVIVALLVLLGAGSQLWQPFMLGFEHDDWMLFVRAHFLQDYSNYHPDRPGYFLLSQVILHVWNGSPAEFQWIKVIINLATAGSIFWLALSIQRLFHAASLALAAGAAVFWLTAPWGLGYTVWATAAFTNIALLFFCVSMVQFVRWVELGSWFRFAIATLFWIASIETYQSTWFGFVPVGFAVFLAVRDQKQMRNRLFALAFAMLAIQLAGAFYTALTTPKSQNPNTFWFLRHNLRSLIEIQLEFLGPLAFASILLVVGGLIWAARFEQRKREFGRIMAGLALAVFGACGSAALYALAGYIFGDAGEPSKTTVMFTFWIATGFSVILAANAEDRRKRIVGIATSCAAIAINFLSFPSMAGAWVDAWTKQREILDTVKAQSFPRQLQRGDIVLGDFPALERDVPVFGAPWSATSAMMIAWADVIPDMARHNPPAVTITSFDGDFKMAWEPGKLTLKPGMELAGKRLWLWRWKTGEAVLLKSAGALPRDGFDALFEANK